MTEIDEMSFDVFSSTVLNPSSPRISLPLDLDADGDTEAWAYLSAYYCYSPGKPQIYGFLPVNFLLPCPIHTSLGDGPHAGLGALAAAYPGARVAADNYVFVILDDSPATAELRNVRIGRVSTP